MTLNAGSAARKKFGFARLRRPAILGAMSPGSAAPSNRVATRREGDALLVQLEGHWEITEPRPAWTSVRGAQQPARVIIHMAGVESWDSSLLLFVLDASRWCREEGVPCDLSGLRPAVRELLGQMTDAQKNGQSPPASRAGFLTRVGLKATGAGSRSRDISQFVGEVFLSAVYLVKHPRKFRWGDCLTEMQHCGAMALPIVSLISFLVGLTLAYTGAVILRQFGADIWVADLVGLTMVREMGAVMTAIVLAGRTGAAFAATLGNMKANEEIDALVTLGIRPIDFLVMPRIVALAAMMPLLALYANCLGILGGMAVALVVLDIAPTAYWIEMLTMVDLSDLSTGLIKALTFGIIVGLAGCLRGLQAERSASGVGQAATSAVVTAILLIIVADAVYAVVFNILDW